MFRAIGVKGHRAMLRHLKPCHLGVNFGYVGAPSWAKFSHLGGKLGYLGPILAPTWAFCGHVEATRPTPTERCGRMFYLHLPCLGFKICSQFSWTKTYQKKSKNKTSSPNMCFRPTSPASALAASAAAVLFLGLALLQLILTTQVAPEKDFKPPKKI